MTMHDTEARAAQVFAGAIELEATARKAYLDDACGHDDALRAEVNALLSAAESGERHLDALGRKLRSAIPVSDAPAVGYAGMKVGPYVLSAPLGEGGMGTVWRAQRCDGYFDSEVAIKILRPMVQSSDRFALEAQHLAKLSHPNIARLLDAGVDEAHRRYLILELVDGTDIEQFCNQRSLNVTERVRLFLDVLAAVSHAHSHLVIHRDLKPSNVLVDGIGTVKLLDFGISKLVSPGEDAPESSLPTSIALTPDYAAPEQLRGDPVTTATDVHGLGLLLYVLLVGRNPCRGAQRPDATPAPSALLRSLISSEDARVQRDAAERRTTPRLLRRAMNGDLDGILLKALAAVPSNRYSSADEMAADLKRYLEGRPVRAAPPSVGYHLRRFVGRHRVAVSAAMLAMAALFAAAVVSGLQMLEARRQRDAAIYQQERVRASNEFYSLLLEELGSRDQPMTALDLLDRGAILLKSQFGARPVAGRIHHDLARTYASLRETKRQKEFLALAEEHAKRNGDQNLLAAVLCDQSRVLLLTQPEAARAKVRRAREILSSLRHVSMDGRIGCLRAEARVAEGSGDRDDAIAILLRARRRLEESPVPSTNLLGTTLNDLAWMLYKAFRYAEAEAILRDVEQLLERNGRSNTLGYYQVVNNRSSVLGSMGQIKDELRIKARLNARLEASDWKDGRAAIGFRLSYATTLVRMARHREAFEILWNVRREAERIGNLEIAANTDLTLAKALVATRRFDEATRRLDAAAAVLSKNRRAWEAQSTRIEILRADIDRALGRIDSAMARSRDILKKIGYPERKRGAGSLVSALYAGAKNALAAKSYEEAERYATDVLALKAPVTPDVTRSAPLGGGLLLRARARFGRGQNEEGLRDLRRAVVALENGLGAEHPTTIEGKALLSEQLAEPGTRP